MNFKLLDIEDVSLNEKLIKKYIMDVLKQNFERDIMDIEVNDKYENMKKFVEDNTALVIGSFDSNKLTGFLWAYKRISNNEERIHISYLVVNEEYRSKGIGTKLLDFLKNVAHENGISKVELMVSSSNKQAIGFYKKHDFYEERVSLCKQI